VKAECCFQRTAFPFCEQLWRQHRSCKAYGNAHSDLSRSRLNPIFGSSARLAELAESGLDIPIKFSAFFPIYENPKISPDQKKQPKTSYKKPQNRDKGSTIQHKINQEAPCTHQENIASAKQADVCIASAPFIVSYLFFPRCFMILHQAPLPLMQVTKISLNSHLKKTNEPEKQLNQSWKAQKQLMTSYASALKFGFGRT